MTGLRLAFAWLTVLPITGPDSVDRAAARRAVTFIPVVGLALGSAASVLLWLLVTIGFDAPIAALAVVAGLALATRGMHLDGLADTFDGLGCYGSPERAREVMRSGGSGPFGVAAIVVALSAQTLAFASLAHTGHWFAIAIAVTTGRVAAVLACRTGYDAAPESRFGALVAGTQPLWVGAAWAAAVTVASAWTTAQLWLGPVAVCAALATALVVVAHCVRRFGGLNGDALGASIEVAVALCAVLAGARA